MSDQSGDGVLWAASLRSELWLSRWWCRYRSFEGSRRWCGLEGAGCWRRGGQGHTSRTGTLAGTLRFLLKVLRSP